MTKKLPPVEREFGVPIPGRILDPASWTKTALKKLPADGPLDTTALFGRSAPLIVDLGCGNGRFLLASALARPDMDHLGIDILPMVLRYATRRGNQRGLTNLRFAAIDAQRFVATYLPPHGVHEIHCYHPQPFHDQAEAHKRLLTPRFLAQVQHVLEPAGKFFVQTDSQPYWDYFRTIVEPFFAFHEQSQPWPDAPRGRTRREILALSRGYPIYRGWGVVKKDRTLEESLAFAAAMPMPTFNAGPRRKDLDQMERE
jgi:tRNA (guanine-N7-)-methyltransferase